MPSLLDKVWEAHVVDRAPGEPDLLYVDRHLIHEVTTPQAFEGLKTAGRKVRRPDLTFAVIDHVIPTDDRSRPLQDEIAEAQLAALEKNQADFGIKVFFGATDPRQGVIHAVMPEQGIILPGNTVCCGDSHTATHGLSGPWLSASAPVRWSTYWPPRPFININPNNSRWKSKAVCPRGCRPKTLFST